MLLEKQHVKFMPKVKEEGVIYISLRFRTAIHLCACGCGNETVTPINNNEWNLIDDENGITLSPSIGNYSFECKSHYWIRNNKIVWA